MSWSAGSGLTSKKRHGLYSRPPPVPLPTSGAGVRDNEIDLTISEDELKPTLGKRSFTPPHNSHGRDSKKPRMINSAASAHALQSTHDSQPQYLHTTHDIKMEEKPPISHTRHTARDSSQSYKRLPKADPSSHKDDKRTIQKFSCKLEPPTGATVVIEILSSDDEVIAPASPLLSVCVLHATVLYALLKCSNQDIKPEPSVVKKEQTPRHSRLFLSASPSSSEESEFWGSKKRMTGNKREVCVGCCVI
jgi:hypothetical protein